MCNQFWVGVTSDGRVYIQDEDFTHDARLYVNGDFGETSVAVAYGKQLCNILNQIKEKE